MKHILKTFLVIILVVLCFWALAIPVQADSRCLYDNANLMTSSDEGYINSVASDIIKNQDYDLCIGTTTSLSSMTSMEYARAFAQTYGFSDDCIVFLIYQDSLYIYQFGNVSLLTHSQINALETGFAIEVANSNTYYALSYTLNNTKQYVQKSSGLNDIYNSDDIPVESSTWKKLLPDGVS